MRSKVDRYESSDRLPGELQYRGVGYCGDSVGVVGTDD